MSTATLSHHSVHRGKGIAMPSLAIPWKFIYFLAAICSVLMLIFYIFQVNQLTMESYLIKNDNRQMSMLTQENTDLQANFAQTSFLGQVQSEAASLDFQKTTNVAYVQLLQPSLAEAK